MLFGIEEVMKDNGSLIGWIGGATALLMCLAQVIVMVWNAYSDKKEKSEQLRHNNQQEKLKSQQEIDTRAISQWVEVSERLQRQVDRLDIHCKDQADAIFLLHQDHSTCEAELNQLYSYVDYLYDACGRVLRAAKKLGLDEDNELPIKPIRQPRPDKGAFEFKMRTLQQRQETLTKNTQNIHNENTAGNKPQAE